VDGLESSDISDSDVVKDLVSSFLLPEVSRSELRSQVHTHTHTHTHTCTHTCTHRYTHTHTHTHTRMLTYADVC
jgi:hypothetical protein